ncbi:MAG: hypothetical protein U1G07_20570 [Verrucomicrobiota bacterium]
MPRVSFGDNTEITRIATEYHPSQLRADAGFFEREPGGDTRLTPGNGEIMAGR